MAMIESQSRIWKLVTRGVSLRVLRAVLQVVVLAIIVRILSPESFGIYVFLIAVTQVISVPVQLGLPQLVLRDTAILIALGDKDAIRALAAWGAKIILIASLVGIGLGCFVLVLLDGPDVTAPQTMVAMILIPVAAFTNLRSSQMRGMGIGARAQTPELLLAPIIFAGWAVLLVGGKDLFPKTIDTVLVGRLLSVIVAAVFAQWMFRRGLAELRPPKSPQDLQRPSTDTRRRLRASLIFGVSAAIYALNGNLDLLMITFLKGEDVTAIYRIAMLAAFGLGLFVQAMNTAVSPTIAQTLNGGDKVALRHALSKLMIRLNVIVWPMILLGILVGKPVLVVVFGNDYAAAYLPMLVLMGVVALNLVFGPVGLLLTLSGHENHTLRAGVISLMLNIVINVLLIPPLGAVGAAIATMVAVFSFNVQLWQRAVNLTGVNTLRWLGQIGPSRAAEGEDRYLS